MARHELSVEGEITERDYLGAQWLHMKPRRGFRLAGYAVLSLFVVAYLLALVAGASSGDPQAILSLLVPVAVILLAGALLRWQYRRTYRGQPSLHGIQMYRFSETGITAESPHGSGEASWTVFTKWREDPNLFLLYQANNLFHIFPKRWFEQSTSSLEEFRVLLEMQSVRCVK